MLLRHSKTENDAPPAATRTRRLDDRAEKTPPRSAADGRRTRRFPIWCWFDGGAVGADLDIVRDAIPAQGPREDQAMPSFTAPTRRIAADHSMPRRLRIRSGYCWSGTIPAVHELAFALTAAAAPRRAARSPTMLRPRLAVIDFDIDDWDDVSFRRGRIELFVSPKLLKRLGGERHRAPDAAP